MDILMDTLKEILQNKIITPVLKVTKIIFSFIYLIYRKFSLKWYLTPKIKKRIIEDLKSSKDNDYITEKVIEVMIQAKYFIKEEVVTTEKKINYFGAIVEIGYTKKYTLFLQIPNDIFNKYKKTQKYHSEIGRNTNKEILEFIINKSFYSFRTIIGFNVEYKTHVEIVSD